MDDLSSYNLLKAARAAAVAGDRAEAARLARQAVALKADDKQAWLLLAASVDETAEKRQAIQRVLALDPFNEEAKAALARLDGNVGASAAIEPALDVLHCANHPDRETRLRCNRCNKPICTECAVQTPVGYRCRECVRGQQNKFYTASTSNVALAYAAAFACGIVLAIGAFLLGHLLGGYLGWIAAFFAGPAVGGALAEVIWRAAGRKRSRNLDAIVTALALIPALLGVLLSGDILTAIIFVAMAASTLYARTRVRS